MSEMFDAINAHSDAAAEKERRQQEETAQALADWEYQQKLRRKAKNRRADIAFGVRVAIFAALGWAMSAATDAGLMDTVLTGGLMLLLFLWFGFQAGAWWQFRFSKGGFLSGCSK